VANELIGVVSDEGAVEIGGEVGLVAGHCHRFRCLVSGELIAALDAPDPTTLHPAGATCSWFYLPFTTARDSQIIPNQREWMLGGGGTIHVFKDNDRF
jgi:hypothetical protein